MSRAGTPLDAGDAFPGGGWPTVADGELSLPTALVGRWGVVLGYRAHW